MLAHDDFPDRVNPTRNNTQWECVYLHTIGQLTEYTRLLLLWFGPRSQRVINWFPYKMWYGFWNNIVGCTILPVLLTKGLLFIYCQYFWSPVTNGWLPTNKWKRNHSFHPKDFLSHYGEVQLEYWSGPLCSHFGISNRINLYLLNPCLIAFDVRSGVGLKIR